MSTLRSSVQLVSTLVILLLATDASAQIPSEPVTGVDTAEPRVLTTIPERDTSFPVVSPPRLMSQEEIRAQLGLTRPMPPEASGIEVPPPLAPSAPSLGMSFEGIGDVSVPFPPDGGLAAGDAYLVQVTNAGIAYFTKNGDNVFQTSLGAFFGNSNGVFDPRVLFDTDSQRFFVVASTFASEVLLAVSLSGNPRDGFCTYTLGSPNFPDFPMLGVSPTTITISTNQFMGDNFVGQYVFFLPKASLIACSGFGFTFAFNFQDCNGVQNFTLQPAHMYGGSNTGFLAATAGGNSITLWRVNQAGPISFERICQPVAGFSAPPLAIQPGGGVGLDTLGTRLDHVIWRDNRLLMSHAGAGGGCADGPGGLCSALFFKEFDVSAFPTVTTVQDTVFFTTAFYLWQPDIAWDANRNVSITYSFTSAPFNRFPGVAASSRNAGGVFDLSPGLVAEGQANYQAIDQFGRNRWGDYFGAAPDPCTNKGTWHEHEYAGTSNLWRTRIGNVFGSAPPPNDACVAAIPIGGFPFSDARDTTFATFAESDPLDACIGLQDNGSVWYRFTSPGTGNVTMDTFGSSYDTVLSVYQESGVCANQSSVACSDDASGVQSQVTFPVVPGAVYDVKVSEFAVPSCTTQSLVLHGSFIAVTTPTPTGTPTPSRTPTRTPTSTPTPTSACGGAAVVPATGGTFTGTTSGASTLASTCGQSGASPEKVFQWSPSVSGVATIETCGAGTNYDSVVYIRSGSCPSGTQVACNDDACANSTGQNRASRITPTVTAGQTYFIVVDGFNGAHGDFSLKITPPQGTCANPIDIPAAGGSVSGTTSGSSALAGTCGRSGASPEKVYRWTPAASGAVTMQTCGAGTNYDSVVYLRRGPCATGTQVACNDDACANSTGQNRASRITPTVTAGQTYFIAVDGFNGAAGSFTLNVTP